MMVYLPVLLGTIRSERKSEHVARHVVERLGRREGVETRLFDPRDWPFGNLDKREWEMEERPEWVAEFVSEMGRADGFLIVSPEYNRGYPGTLKNMIDAVYDEWNRKPFGIVSVGGVSGGMHMTEQLRNVFPGIGAIGIPASVPVQFVAKTFGPDGPAEPETWNKRFDHLFEELEWYARALRDARQRDERQG